MCGNGPKAMKRPSILVAPNFWCLGRVRSCPPAIKKLFQKIGLDSPRKAPWANFRKWTKRMARFCLPLAPSMAWPLV